MSLIRCLVSALSNSLLVGVIMTRWEGGDRYRWENGEYHSPSWKINTYHHEKNHFLREWGPYLPLPYLLIVLNGEGEERGRLHLPPQLACIFWLVYSQQNFVWTLCVSKDPSNWPTVGFMLIWLKIDLAFRSKNQIARYPKDDVIHHENDGRPLAVLSSSQIPAAPGSPQTVWSLLRPHVSLFIHSNLDGFSAQRGMGRPIWDGTKSWKVVRGMVSSGSIGSIWVDESPVSCHQFRQYSRAQKK